MLPVKLLVILLQLLLLLPLGKGLLPLEKGSLELVTMNAPMCALCRRDDLRFKNLSVTVGKEEAVTKQEKWQSWLEVEGKFGEEEANRHILSGRLLTREDPLTRGVWQYQDQGDITRTLKGTRGKRLKMHQDGTADSEYDDDFGAVFDTQLEGMLAFDLSYSDLGKGAKGKGKGVLGKGKGKANKPLALEDKPRTEEELKEAALLKAKKMKALLEACLA